MRTPAAAFALVLALTAPATADAGVYLGLRAGAAFPSGDVAAGESLSSQVDFAIPITGEAGWKFANGLTLAAYLRLAPLELDERVRDLCDDLDATCEGGDLGIGLEALYELGDVKPLQPWVGAFVGFNALGYEATFAGEEAQLGFAGWELGLQGGLDFDLTPFTVGPYVQLGWGRFTDAVVDPEDGPEDDEPIDDRRWHLWTSVGLKLGVAF